MKHLEDASPACSSSLILTQRRAKERLQRCATTIILGPSFQQIDSAVQVTPPSAEPLRIFSRSPIFIYGISNYCATLAAPTCLPSRRALRFCKLLPSGAARIAASTDGNNVECFFFFIKMDKTNIKTHLYEKLY